MADQVISSNSQEQKEAKNLPVRNNGVWATIKAFFTKKVEVTMTPSQQKIVDFLGQDVDVTMTPKQEKTIQKMRDFLFQEVTFGKKNKNK